MMRIQMIGRSESMGGYGDREGLDVRKVKRFERSEILGGWEGRKFLVR
jgi:hypothetical protein